jgi:hypothetical protein
MRDSQGTPAALDGAKHRRPRHQVTKVASSIGLSLLTSVSVSLMASPVGASTNPLAPLANLPASIVLPITALGNEIGSTGLPIQDATTGSSTTTQSSPVANVSAPIDVCSVSAGVLAPAGSSCSTTSVGTDQHGAIANVNVPITAESNAVGLLGQSASALGAGTSTNTSTTQSGAVNAFVPVTACAINVGVIGGTSSACDDAGSNGVSSQTGAVDATVPVTVCDVIVEIIGNATSGCPTDPSQITQTGQVADLSVPVAVCGVVAEVDGDAAGQCLPGSSTPLVGGLPNTAVTQSALIDGVLPVNACSILIAVDGSASNQCEPAQGTPSQLGDVPINVPATVCAAAVAVKGTATATCTGGTAPALPTLSTSSLSLTLPITLCGGQAALSGTASATCPSAPATTSTNNGTTGTVVSTSANGDTIPVDLTAVTPAAPSTVATTPPSSTIGAPMGTGGPLAFTGATLSTELAIGLSALAAGLCLIFMVRRRRNADAMGPIDPAPSV